MLFLRRRNRLSWRAVVSLVERGGKFPTFHVDHAKAENVREVIVRNVSRKSTMHTDESKLYFEVGTEFAKIETVKHSAKEYVRGDVHTNTVEGFFSIFKRGMKGVYQHSPSLIAATTIALAWASRIPNALPRSSFRQAASA